MRRLKKNSQSALDAAAAVFAEYGFHGATTARISERLGIRQGSLYYYFRSKQAALEQVCERGILDYVETVEAVRGSGAPASEKVRAMIASHLEPVLTHQDYVRVFLRDRRHLSEPARGRIRSLAREYEAQVEGIFRDGIEAGEFRADLDCRMTTLAVLGMCNAATHWYGIEPEAPLDRIVDGFAALVVDGCRSARGAQR